MPAVIRPSSCLRAARAVQRSTSTSTSTTTASSQMAAFSTTPRAAGGAHGSQYDPPTGWLFGVKPGEKYQNEGWEGPFFYGFCGSIALFTIAYAFKPDTSIQTWALEEARRRLEAEGILEDPEKK
ncbi:ESSS subunit of NADH:ubiquinone oxidoreductase-domain-containing protein [Bombardia bombarda]|uniref:NADH dehydrogenase [ubiquinone] 1 beta subcomplex subunit 11, mitochondrial n=1 Tax=Bombardia bombarda TaxID=252184 RepID=A0AA39X7T9_9PEZI|nr:ESSS subunit of NADH:ubiquinone oxidoreductase-domain-containing protein [Bombardia bombarda]